MKFDGKDVASMRGLPRAVSQTQVGRTVDLEILRKGQKKVLKVVIGRLQEDEDNKDKETAKKPEDGKPSSKALVGLGLAPLTDELRTKYKLDPKSKGVVVVEADATSPAAQKGIKPGDLIVEAAQDPVTSVEDVSKAIEKVRKSGRKQLLLRIESGKGDMRFVAVPIE